MFDEDEDAFETLNSLIETMGATLDENHSILTDGNPHVGMSNLPDAAQAAQWCQAANTYANLIQAKAALRNSTPVVTAEQAMLELLPQ